MLEGVPGLSDLPVVGHLFAHTRKETLESDIVLTLTPHIIRVLDLTEDDLRPFRVGRDEGIGGGVIELPIPPELPPRDTPAQEQQQRQQQPGQQPPPPPPAPGGAQPIVPPPTTPGR